MTDAIRGRIFTHARGVLEHLPEDDRQAVEDYVALSVKEGRDSERRACEWFGMALGTFVGWAAIGAMLSVGSCIQSGNAVVSDKLRAHNIALQARCLEVVLCECNAEDRDDD